MKAKLNYEELTVAFDRWNNVYPRNTFASFERFLDIPVDLPSSYDPEDDAWWMEVEAVRRVRLLLGPHYITIIKVIAIRNGDASVEAG